MAVVPYQSETLTSFGIDFKKISLLSPEEERELFARLKANPDDKGIKEIIMRANLRLVRQLARKFSYRSARLPSSCLDFDDLFQEGVGGLKTAIEKFDVSMGCKFSTYAIWWIRQAIWRAIANKGSLIHVPAHVNEEISRILGIEEDLRYELGRDPLPQEVATRANVPCDKLHEIYKCATLRRSVSLNSSPKGLEGEGYDSQPDFLNIVSSECDDIDEIVHRRLLRDIISQALESLGESDRAKRQRAILRLIFGLDGIELNSQQIADKFGISRQRICEITSRALAVLRANPSIRGLKT